MSRVILIALIAGTAAGWFVGGLLDKWFFSGVGTR